MVGDRWQLNEEDEWDYEEEPRRQERASAPPPDSESLYGQDSECSVTVYVTEAAEVLSVKLADTWKSLVDPRSLDASVLAAANAATMQALAKQVDEQRASEVTQKNPAPTPVVEQDDSPLSKADVNRLLDAVSADLEEFTRRVNEIVEQPVTSRSSGGNVEGTAQSGQILTIAVDAGWASAARNSEIETELLELLQSLRSKSSVDDLANGPQSSAISEFNQLFSDSSTLLRRLGMQTRSPSTSL